VSVADCFRLTGGRARDVVPEVAAAVAGWQGVARGHGLAQRNLAAMAPAFAALAQVGDLGRRPGSTATPSGRVGDAP